MWVLDGQRITRFQRPPTINDGAVEGGFYGFVMGGNDINAIVFFSSIEF